MDDVPNRELTARSPAAAGQLVVADLAVRRGDRLCVDGVSFTAASGEVTGLLGPNGAGKTTTFAALAGQLPRERGTAALAGQPLRSHRIGYAPQSGALYPLLSGHETARCFAAFARIPRSRRAEAVTEAIRVARLEGREHDRVGTYSGGMRQRLSLALALLGEPDVLLLDEPTAGVDPQAREHLLDQIRETARRTGAVVLFSSHYLEEVEALCDHVVVLDGGTALIAGTPDELNAASSARTSAVVELSPEQVAELVHGLDGSEVQYDPAARLLTVVTVGSESPVAELLAHLERLGSAATELTVRPPSLAETFLRLTGTELRD